MRFTAESARIAAAKSAESRRQSPLQGIPPGCVVVPAERIAPPVHVPADDSYPELRKCRVRAQLDRLDQMMMEEKDPQKLDRIASAVARLSEQERQLSGRPLPGTLRPAQSNPKRRPDPTSEPTPAPSCASDTPSGIRKESIIKESIIPRPDRPHTPRG